MIKACVYKGCESFTVDNVANGSFTLFNFPKDLERRKHWMELGQVAPLTPANGMLMCSKHFDSKYFSINQRRTMLIGNALPNPYVESDTRTKTPEEDEDDCYELFDNDEDVLNQEIETLDEQEYPVELKTTMQGDEDDNVHTFKKLLTAAVQDSRKSRSVEDDQSSNSSMRKVVTLPATGYGSSRKRKLLDPASASKAKSKLPKSKVENSDALEKSQVQKEPQKTGPKIIQNTEKKPVEKVQANIIDESTLIDVKQVSTFIFKGEEYVQMPKEHYVKEKTELLQKIMKYESLIRTIQQKVNAFDLS